MLCFMVTVSQWFCGEASGGSFCSLGILGDGSLYCKSAFIWQALKIRSISSYL